MKVLRNPKTLALGNFSLFLGEKKTYNAKERKAFKNGNRKDAKSVHSLLLRDSHVTIMRVLLREHEQALKKFQGTTIKENEAFHFSKSVAAIAAALDISKSAANQRLQRLEKAGFITGYFHGWQIQKSWRIKSSLVRIYGKPATNSKPEHSTRLEVNCSHKRVISTIPSYNNTIDKELAFANEEKKDFVCDATRNSGNANSVPDASHGNAKLPQQQNKLGDPEIAKKGDFLAIKQQENNDLGVAPEKGITKDATQKAIHTETERKESIKKRFKAPTLSNSQLFEEYKKELSAEFYFYMIEKIKFGKASLSNSYHYERILEFSENYFENCASKKDLDDRLNEYLFRIDIAAKQMNSLPDWDVKRFFPKSYLNRKSKFSFSKTAVFVLKAKQWNSFDEFKQVPADLKQKVRHIAFSELRERITPAEAINKISQLSTDTEVRERLMTSYKAKYFIKDNDLHF